MEIQNLLNRDVVCSCGRTHRCNIGTVEIGKDALDTLPRALKSYHSVLIVADENTYPLCGQRVAVLLGEKHGGTCLFQTTRPLIPNEETVAHVESFLSAQTDLILGIGSGVINDICKYTAFYHGIKSGIVATAPSMDGYASSGAAMILEGMKVTVTTQAPDVIIGDTEILKTAPMDMIRAGYGDIIGKYSSLNDWQLAHLIRSEHFCPTIHDLVLKTTDDVRDAVDGIVAREDVAIEMLMRALVLIGITLTLVESTRPGSGSEHHLSHFFEIVGLIHGEKHFSHGIDVAYNTILTAGMREQILHAAPTFDEEPRAQRETAWERIFGPVAPSVAELQREAGLYEQDLHTVYREKWQAMQAILAKCPTARDCAAMLRAAGIHFADCEAAYGHEKLCDAMLYGKDLKNRYSVLWVYYALFSNDRTAADYRRFDMGEET